MLAYAQDRKHVCVHTSIDLHVCVHTQVEKGKPGLPGKGQSGLQAEVARRLQEESQLRPSTLRPSSRGETESGSTEGKSFCPVILAMSGAMLRSGIDEVDRWMDR